MSRVLLICALLTAAVIPVAAEQSVDRVQVGRDILVTSSESAGDLVCVLCSIRVRGQATGSAVAVFGNITLDQGSRVAEDAVAVAGSIRMLSGSSVGGDTTVVGGSVRRDPQASISGDVTALEGSYWILLMMVSPILVFGALVALVIWLVQRNRRIAPVPA